MTTKVEEDFKIFCKFKRRSKKQEKIEEEIVDKFVRLTTYHMTNLFYDFLDKYKINNEDLVTGKITIEDIKRKIELKDVHDNLSKIINLIKDNHKITLSEMAKAIGKSKKTVQRVIAASNKVTRIGSVRNGYWEIKE